MHRHWLLGMVAVLACLGSANTALSQCVGGTANGVVQTGEACDDDAPANNDGCSSTCAIEDGWNCGAAADFSTIVAEGAGSGNWVVSPDGLTGTQTVNSSAPTFGLAGIEGQATDGDGNPLTYEFEVGVATTSDDDFLGFAIGYNTGDFANPAANYILLDWKQSNQSICGITTGVGMAVSHVTNVTTTGLCPFWAHQTANGVEEIQRAATLGTTGWVDNRFYNFEITYTPTSLLVEVDDGLGGPLVTQFNLTPADFPAGAFPGNIFPAGEIAFYGLSQSNTRYTVDGPFNSLCNEGLNDASPRVCRSTGGPSTVDVTGFHTDPSMPMDTPDPASLMITAPPAGATATANMMGEITVTPAMPNNAVDLTTNYTLCDDDRSPACGTGQLVISLNDPPTLMGQSAMVLEQASTTFTGASVQINGTTGTRNYGWIPSSLMVATASGGPFGTSVPSALGGVCEITAGGDVQYTAPIIAGGAGGMDSCFVQLCEERCDVADGEQLCGEAQYTFMIPACDCVIGGMCISDGATDPANACLVCRPASDRFAYTPTAGCDPCTMDSQCMAPRPACDTAEGICVECTASNTTECLGNEPFCNTGVNSCEPCSTNAQCAAADASLPFCSMAGPNSGACVECLADMNCPDGDPICNAVTNTCGPCGTDLECMAADATLPLCDTASGDCEECLTDANCPDDEPVCDPASKTCGPCRSDAQCFAIDATVPYCDLTSGECEECLTDSNCGGTTPVCNPTTLVCVPCSTDPECAAADPALPVCDTGTCITCEDDGVGVIDNGCDDRNPACEPVGGIATCLNCEDNEMPGAVDNGCPNSLPACDVTNPDSPICRACLADGDCTTGVCNTTTRSCESCVDDSDGGLDSGCSMDRPACDESGSEPVCVPCEDNTDGGTDNGCDSDSPVCDTSGMEATCINCEDSVAMGGPDNGCMDPTDLCDVSDPAAPTCIECFDTDDCPDATPVCNPSNQCVPGCVDDGDCAGTPATPVCDTGSNSCVECLMDSNCPAEMPVCNGDTNACEECLMDSDCPDTAPVCDPASFECEECLMDSDCPDTAPACDTTNNTCVGCLDNDDCPMGVCDVAAMDCQECLGDADCPSGEVCDPDGMCVECVDDDACAPGSMCDVTSNTCGPQCESDMDCVVLGLVPPAPVCDEGSCVECVLDTDCAEGEVCDLGTNMCDPECATSDDCPDSAPICSPDNTCGQCNETADCPDGMGCNTTTNMCEMGCMTDEDCLGALVCDPSDGICYECVNDGDCDDGVCGSGNTCEECFEDADCPSGELCDTTENTCYDGCTMDADCMNPALPVCIEASGECVECEMDGDCTDGEICDTAVNVCRPGCDNDSDCMGDLVCDMDARTCVGCTGDEDCDGAFVCNLAVQECVPTCTVDADCPLNLPECNTEVGMCVQCAADNLVACVGGTPVCDTDTETCVGCLSDGDCPDESPVCDLENRVCKLCSADNNSACPEDAPICLEESDRCVECTADDASACPDDAPMCDADSNTCITGGCETNEECPSNAPLCDDGECTDPGGPECRSNDDCTDADLPVCDEGVCVECASAGDCGEDEACGPANTCVPACTTDDDCSGDTPACFVDGGYCVECTNTDDHCGDDEICNEALFTCAPGCDDDDDCDDGFCGDDDFCVGCRSDDDCEESALGPVCGDGGVCGAGGCTTDAECGSGELCDELTGFCYDGCGDDDECTNPRRPVCLEDDERCVECEVDGDCADSETCSTDGNFCEPGSSTTCTDDSECDAGEYCDDDGGCAPGDRCEDDDECVSSTFGLECNDDGLCGCSTDADCPDDLVCNDDGFCDDGTIVGPTEGGLAGGACSAVAADDAGTFLAVLGLGALLFRRRRRS